jgi:curved DNA-binding protein CbpA
MSDMFDPKKIIDFNKNYYEILDLDKNSLPFGGDRSSKVDLSNILDKAFRKKARVCHPDFGGSKEAFLDIVRARRVIEDPLLRSIYEKGEFEETRFVGDGQDQFSVDWDKVGTYRKGTPEDTVGFSLFLSLCERKKELNLIPAFFPDSNEHNYEWDWVIGEANAKIALSIVNDENEVLRLTSGESIDESLPFKIYICIPRAQLYLKRNHEERIVSPDGSKTMINGSLMGAAYNDYNLLETTNLEEAKQYISGNKIVEDLTSFRRGDMAKEKLVEDKSKNQNKWMSGSEMNKIDKELLTNILKMRTVEVKPDENAADFIEKIGEKKTSSALNDKPELPL